MHAVVTDLLFLYQVRKWPLNPLDLIVKSIAKRKDSPVVADFGCGEAKLAERLESRCQKIHSFDLVAKNERVTVCDFSRYVFCYWGLSKHQSEMEECE